MTTTNPASLTGPIPFGDSTDPIAIPFDAAALYHDGLYGPAGLAAGHRFRHTRWITIAADWRNCGIADFEPGNPVYDTPELLTSYLRGRATIERRGRIYCDVTDVPRAVSYAAGQPHEWWIAAWDGPDGQPGYKWTAAELAAHILRLTGIAIHPDYIWGIQYIGGAGKTFDTSVLCAGRTW